MADLDPNGNLITGGEEIAPIGETPKQKADREARNDATKRQGNIDKGNAKEKKSRRQILYDRNAPTDDE